MKTREELNAEWAKLDSVVIDVDIDKYPEEHDTLLEWIAQLRREDRGQALREAAQEWREKHSQNAHAQEWANALVLRAEQIEKEPSE